MDDHGDLIVVIPFSGYSIVGKLYEDGFFLMSQNGNPDIPDFNLTDNKSPIFEDSRITSVFFENGFEKIGDYVFYGCDNIQSVDFATSTTSLGRGCFQNCSSLVQAYIPYKCLTWGQECFRGCSSLVSINMPHGMSSVPSRCYQDCVSLSKVDLPFTLLSVGSYGFSGCSSLTFLELPPNVTYLSGYAFTDAGLEEIILPSVFQFADQACFANCVHLSVIRIHATTTPILGTFCFAFVGTEAETRTVYGYPFQTALRSMMSSLDFTWVDLPLFKEWTEEDFYSFEDLNRVEAVTHFVNKYLATIGYNIDLDNIITDRKPLYNDLFFEFADSLTRIESNIHAIREGFVEPPEYENPKEWQSGISYDYRDANRLENNLKLLYEWALKLSQELGYCGSLICGDIGGIY